MTAPRSIPQEITSLQNPRVKNAVQLRKRSHRDQEGTFLIEGFRELKRAMDNHWNPVTLFYCEEFFLGANEVNLIRRCRESDVEIFKCPPHVFQKMAYRDRPEGLLAVAPQKTTSLDELRLADPPLVMAAESIEKPGNLGTMLRSADAAGADAVIVCDPCTDIFNPNVVRASIGTLFTVPVVVASTQETIAWLKKNSIRILAATPHADLLYTDADLRSGLAVIVGTEQYGLSQSWLTEADLSVRIPMKGQADSLNVATAVAILLFEALRQRHGKATSS